MRALGLLALAALMAAGCAGPAPPQAPSTAEVISSWEYTIQDDRGDWYMQLTLQALADRTVCSARMAANGEAASPGPQWLAGTRAGGVVTLTGSSRTGWGGVYAAGTNATADSSTYTTNSFLESSGTGVRLDAGEEGVLFWAARGLVNDGFNALPLRVRVECDQPARLVERAQATRFLLFDDRSFQTVVAPINSVVYADGEVTFASTTDRTLFAFQHLGAQRATLELSGAAQGSWDASDHRDVRDHRHGFVGEATLHLTQSSPPVDENLYSPWLDGLFVEHVAVALFPGEGEAGPDWRWTLPAGVAGDVALDVRVSAPAATTCRFVYDATGRVDGPKHAALWATWGATPAYVTWFSGTGHLYRVQAAGQGTHDDAPWGYGHEDEGRSFALAAGESHLAWAFSDPSHAQVDLDCDGGFEVLDARVAQADLPTAEALQGTLAYVVLPYAVASGAYDVPLSGRLVLVLDPVGTGLLTVTDAAGSRQFGPQDGVQALGLVAPVRIEFTGQLNARGLFLSIQAA